MVKITFSNKLAYTIIVLAILALVAVGINAYESGGPPSTIGHTADELDLGAFDVSGAPLGHLRLMGDELDPSFIIGDIGLHFGALAWDSTKDIFEFRVGLNKNQLVLGEAGNVGIGTDTPTKRLDVNGDARVSGELVVDGVIKSETGDVIIQLG